mgnify:CR=1 FL=1
MRSLIFEGNSWIVYEELRQKDQKCFEAQHGDNDRKGNGRDP